MIFRISRRNSELWPPQLFPRLEQRVINQQKRNGSQASGVLFVKSNHQIGPSGNFSRKS